jgi:hypothetical protein
MLGKLFQYNYFHGTSAKEDQASFKNVDTVNIIQCVGQQQSLKHRPIAENASL